MQDEFEHLFNRFLEEGEDKLLFRMGCLHVAESSDLQLFDLQIKRAKELGLAFVNKHLPRIREIIRKSRFCEMLRENKLTPKEIFAVIWPEVVKGSGLVITVVAMILAYIVIKGIAHELCDQG